VRRGVGSRNSVNKEALAQLGTAAPEEKKKYESRRGLLTEAMMLVCKFENDRPNKT